jgi:hypothetical protein
MKDPKPTEKKEGSGSDKNHSGSTTMQISHATRVRLKTVFRITQGCLSRIPDPHKKFKYFNQKNGF